MTECMNCRAQVTNGVALCESCQQTLRIACVNTAAFYTDALRIQPGQRVKVRSAYQSTPPPAVAVSFDPVTIATGHVDAIVVGWVRNLQDDRPTIGEPPADIAKALGWLESHIPSINTLEWAAECLREMVECEQTLQRLLDKADTGWHAGICGNEIGRAVNDDDEVETATCPRTLYGTVGTRWVRCPECGRTWDAEQRRETMMAEARDQAAPVTVIARVVVGLIDGEVSEHRLTRRIEKWIDRGKLRDVGVRVIGGRPRRVYNLGEVFDLVSRERKPSEPAA